MNSYNSYRYLQAAATALPRCFGFGKRCMVVALIAVAGFSATAEAGHLHEQRRAAQQQYARELRAINRRVDAELDALRCAFEERRDCLLAEKRALLRDFCHDRHFQLKRIHRKLAELSRRYAEQRRGVFERANCDRRELLQIHQRRLRVISQVHPDGCGCSMCGPPAQVVPQPLYHDGGGYFEDVPPPAPALPLGHARPPRDRGYGSLNRGAGGSGDVDWAGLVLSLLSRRLNQ